MNPKHVTSLELSKQLKEAGIPQISKYAWTNVDEMGEEQLDWILIEDGDGEAEWLDDGHYVSAFHVGELGEMLPEKILNKETRNMDKLVCGKWNGKFNLQYHTTFTPPLMDIEGDTEAEARGKMLLYLKKEYFI